MMGLTADQNCFISLLLKYERTTVFNRQNLNLLQIGWKEALLPARHPQRWVSGLVRSCDIFPSINRQISHSLILQWTYFTHHQGTHFAQSLNSFHASVDRFHTSGTDFMHQWTYFMHHWTHFKHPVNTFYSSVNIFHTSHEHILSISDDISCISEHMSCIIEHQGKSL